MSTTISTPPVALAEILSVRKRRLTLQREADTLEQEEKLLSGKLINWMNQSNLTEFAQNEDQVNLQTTEEPMATDWPTVLDYIIANKAPDLLQKRLTASAVKARWADGEIIPGVDKLQKQTLKFNV